ncbi:transmembrane protein 145-like isoform X2 [Haemaphysalis longicornis]
MFAEADYSSRITVILVLYLATTSSECKIVQGTLRTTENWAFLTRFCFLSQQGHFIYELNYPVEYGPQNLLLYYDEKHQWPAVYKKPKSCEQKESVLNSAHGQIVNLTDRYEWSQCEITEGAYNCSAQRRFKSARERWWFIAVSNCNTTKGLYLNYILKLYNDDDNFWYRHFSADEFYILHTDIGAFFVYIILFVTSCYGACVLYSRSYLHTTYKMFMVSVLCELLSLLCMVTYYAMYADDGIGIAQLKLLGRVLSSVSTLVFLLLLILVAKGYTVTRGRLKPGTSAKIGTFMTLYVVVYSALFIYERQYFDPGEVLYLYESPAGYGIVALRLIGWGWFVYATVFTLLHYPEKTAFYTRLFLLYTIWLLSAPVIILIAAFVVPKWMREKVINVVEIMVIFFAHVVFLVLTRPSKANKNFPFHVRTTQVDVVQHPTIGVISDNYIDRFPHHAYAPTESIVTEAPVGVAVAAARTSIDYAGLFGAGRQESENNNWQELNYPNQLSVTHMHEHMNGLARGSMSPSEEVAHPEAENVGNLPTAPCESRGNTGGPPETSEHLI